MKHKFFHIPLLDSEATAAELNRFCDQHRIVNVEKHFVADGQSSCWAICVTWLEQGGALAENSAEVKAKKPRVDYKDVLNEEEFRLFSRLRDLRSELAQQEGVAVYNIFTNEQLAQMVQQRLSSNMALLKIDGVGQTRVEKYAEAFLSVIRGWSES